MHPTTISIAGIALVEHVFPFLSGGAAAAVLAGGVRGLRAGDRRCQAISRSLSPKDSYVEKRTCSADKWKVAQALRPKVPSERGRIAAQHAYLEARCVYCGEITCSMGILYAPQRLAEEQPIGSASAGTRPVTPSIGCLSTIRVVRHHGTVTFRVHMCLLPAISL